MQDANWKEIPLPRDELADYLQWMADLYDVNVGDMWAMYRGSLPAGMEAAE